MPKYSAFDQERQHPDPAVKSNRDPFEVDKSRIVHSASFRRLQGKTQVLGVGERDFYRNRLTHSLEVAQLGRGMCDELEGSVFSPNKDLVEAVCLAHDIGHPPFGHKGETVLHSLMMKRHGGFGANPQNLRIVTQLEAKNSKWRGLNLTRATLDGLCKYPEIFRATRHDHSRFTYNEDRGLLRWIKGDKQARMAQKPLEAEIADWADQVTYCVNDIEDILRARLLNYDDMVNRAARISQRALSKLKEEGITPNAKNSVASIAGESNVRALARKWRKLYSEESNLRLRKAGLKAWTSDAIKLLKDDCKIIERRDTEVTVRYKYTLTIPDNQRAWAEILKAIPKVMVFSEPRVTTLEAKAKFIMIELFKCFTGDEKGIALMPLDYQELMEGKSKREKVRLVADFISGMTDRYAYEYYERLFLPGAGSFYQFI
jgi:dGTPase